MSTVLKTFESCETERTAIFCEIFDKFFDCMNVRSVKEHSLKRKKILLPYTKQNYERFIWLKEVFLKYLND